MNFSYSKSQETLREAARVLLARGDCPARIRQFADAGTPPFDTDLWQSVVAAGWCAMSLAAQRDRPAQALELTLLADELGRALAPIPLIDTWLARHAIEMSADQESVGRYLSGLRGGQLRGAIHLPVTIESTAPLNPTLLTPVVNGSVADLLVFENGQGPTRRLSLLDMRQEGVRRTVLRGLDLSRGVAAVDFGSTAAVELGDAAAVTDLFYRAAVLRAFEQLGAADRCLELAADHARQRYQFGRPIGSFQAIKHKLATLYVENELARANCYYAAWALAENTPQLAEATALARISVTQALNLAAQECVHVHGGLGFTWNADPQLYLRRAKAAEGLLGGVGFWEERLLQAMDEVG